MSATLDFLLEPLDQWLDDPATEEICIQEPFVAWVFSHGEFTRHENTRLDEQTIEDIAIVAAAQRQQDVNFGVPRWPLLATDLVGRGRLQAILEPCVTAGYPSLTVRRGSDDWPSLPELAAKGLFRNTSRTRPAKTPADAQLRDLYLNDRYDEFLALAVRSKKSIILCGENASGKTHVSKALIAEIPLHERLITIENAPELRGLKHPNRVQMFVDNAAKESGVKPIHLVSAALRMRIGRLFLQEIKDGEETIAYLLAGQTGHRGSITTIHAGHCAAVFDRMRVLIKQTEGGAAVSDDDVNNQLFELVDVVAHCSRSPIGGFAVDEILYRHET